ncbi:MAG: hypothetical protein GEU83_00745 [Pseudonocardiaceae bacterium]|nr:hypothetical protein [Pseudonocardiaceae bacterium]
MNDSGATVDRERLPGRRWCAALPAALAGLVAVVCAVLLPFAPVSVNEPTVRWPADPANPESTLLTLTAYRPLALDVRFNCDVARAAQATPEGVVVSTAVPGTPETGAIGMVVTAAQDRVRVRGLDRVLLDEPLPAGPCGYRISGHSDGLPSYAGPAGASGQPAPDLDAFAGPGNAELVISRDGREIVRTATEQLPDVDMLATSLRDPPPGIAGELSVELRVDDEFSSAPAPSKSALLWVLLVALPTTAGLLALADRAVPRARRNRRLRWLRRLRWPRAVDVVVPAVLVVWTVIAPATDDDGYFTAQARNATISGEVGNYYQFYDQSFTPFTWPYRALGWWQEFAGEAPVAQRVPALVFGLLTWVLLRRFVAAATAEPAAAARGMRVTAPVVLAAVFLAWWLPQNTGVRPEPVVAACGAATLLAVLAAGRRRRLVLGWLACAVAGLGFTAHTTGFILLGVLLAGLPVLWPLVRVPGAAATTALRALAVGSGGMVAPLVAFADNALRDFQRGQAMFLSVVPQDGWAEEIERYGYLLSQAPMGNFAKRAAVLACLVALGAFALLAVAARLRRVPVPAPLWLAGSATALGFLALAFTPSKWTHHFGTLAGVGSAFLALALVAAVPLTGRVLDGSRPPAGLVVAVAGSFTVVLALSWHGPNDWAYAWLDGVWAAGRPPSVGPVTFDSVVLWGMVVLVVAVGFAVWGRWTGWQRQPRFAALRAVPVVVVASLVATSGYLVGAFGSAAARGTPPGSVWAQGLADPTGTGCGTTAAVRVLDPRGAEPLPPAAGLPPPPPPGGFVAGDGYHAPNAPQGGVAGQVWGSLVAGPDGRSANLTTGRMSTGWYALPPDPAGGAAVTVLAAGRLTGGNGLTAVYGRRFGDTVVPTATESLTDTAPGPSWRTLVLTPAGGADVVRLEAMDATGAGHGWLAFTAPATAHPVALDEFLPDGAPVALGWQLAFAHPCLRQPRVVDGITEPPAYAVLWARSTAGLDGIAWQPRRGGVFGQVTRTQSVLRLATVGPSDPNVEVYEFGTDLRRDAYTLTVDRRTVPGWEAWNG